ncbi:hypothetical protein BN7_6668 [Wickerhamomyces ciferrii]|uniref:Uncharacterized protein n=1 Tax=Wickerhamomyces ciferrii (strain ATCC 14091 / BCRC 22168 / CBS 111 / JCM 3599 / NBRC 0793 / NRRL Y-1031 F-60-10) TaxID=1206466 RepID=K0L0E6_WICCF|nr:uncharacterized protein BN7_6668 [Wickerhamomyces ciferrii]CCH47059.1 hypothetical protein BN7_6668 [Wickerhamomyces ciferrii]
MSGENSGHRVHKHKSLIFYNATQKQNKWSYKCKLCGFEIKNKSNKDFTRSLTSHLQQKHSREYEKSKSFSPDEIYWNSLMRLTGADKKIKENKDDNKYDFENIEIPKYNLNNSILFESEFLLELIENTWTLNRDKAFKNLFDDSKQDEDDDEVIENVKKITQINPSEVSEKGYQELEKEPNKDINKSLDESQEEEEDSDDDDGDDDINDDVVEVQANDFNIFFKEHEPN